MGTEPVIPTTWLGKILGSLPGPPPAQGEIRWLLRILFVVGFSWLGIFLTQAFPYPHGQRPSFVPLLEMALILLSGAASIGALIWFALVRRFLARD